MRGHVPSSPSTAWTRWIGIRGVFFLEPYHDLKETGLEVIGASFGMLGALPQDMT